MKRILLILLFIVGCSNPTALLTDTSWIVEIEQLATSETGTDHRLFAVHSSEKFMSDMAIIRLNKNTIPEKGTVFKAKINITTNLEYIMISVI
jgi:uncharacterized protein YcfL